MEGYCYNSILMIKLPFRNNRIHMVVISFLLLKKSVVSYPNVVAGMLVGLTV